MLFFSPEQLQAANNCSAQWGDLYDGAALAQNFWVVRREENRINADIDRFWPIPMNPDHAMQTQWRHRVFLEVMHFFHVQRRLRWGLPAPRPLDPATFDIPRLNPDAPPPVPPASETRAYTAPLSPEPEDDSDDTASTAPTVLNDFPIPAPVAVPGSPSTHRPSTSYITRFSDPAGISNADLPSSSGVTGAERRALNRELERRRRAHPIRGAQPVREARRTSYFPMENLESDAMRRTLYRNRMPSSSLDTDRNVRVRAPPPTPSAVPGPSSTVTPIPGSGPTASEFDRSVLIASLKRALPNAAVTATLSFLSHELAANQNSTAGEHAALDELQDAVNHFRSSLADIIAQYRDVLRWRESPMLTQWEDERRAMDVEDASFDEEIRRTLGLGPPLQDSPHIPSPPRHEGSYWVPPPSSGSLSAPPPSLVGPGMPPVQVSVASDSPPAMFPIAASTDPTPRNSPTGTPSSIVARKGSETPTSSPTSSQTINDLDFGSFDASTILQYDTACRVDWKTRGRKLEFDVYPGDSSRDADSSKGKRRARAGSGPVIFYEEDTPVLAGQERASPVWDMPGDVEMRESYDDDEPDVDADKVIAASFYQDLARDISVDALMDRAVVRALETIDASAEADILNKCVDVVFEALG
ncbi:hypothetical protein BDZ89DRAFT_1137180 [Hymenopellis radicata]|nr:hypothetical protein BDZ89DRAFT_1137180 [Hymenopellis radicata]